MSNLVKRTSAEIKARYEEVSQHFLDFQGGDLLPYMDFADAQPFLKDGVSEEQLLALRKDPLIEALEYLPFAWDKANCCRGLSAGRSIDHLKAWFWLAGYDLDADFDNRYQYYGKPCLVTASELVGLDWLAHDDLKWRNDESGPGISEGVRDALIIDAIDAAKKHREEVEALNA